MTLISSKDLRILALLTESAAAGDHAMVVICRAAMRGDAECLAEVQRCIDDALAAAPLVGEEES